MTYKETLSNIMNEMSKDDNTVFIGQQIVYRGNPMSTTLDEVSKDKMIEVPVMEETQMGMTLGLAMTGKRVITFYPRWDFLISATNQLVNHVDKFELMTGKKPHIIIRVGKGSDKPLDPGHQHKGNYLDEFKNMCKNTTIFDCQTLDDIKSAYDTAINNVGVYIINEYPEKYGDYNTLNLICDETKENSSSKKMEEIFSEWWYNIENHQICNFDDVRNKPNENFYNINVINNYVTSLLNENLNIPINDKIKQLMRENKNFYVVFLTEHECDLDEIIVRLDDACKKENINPQQLYVINGNEKLKEIKDENKSLINVHTTNRLHLVVSRNMVNFGYDYAFKPDKENLFMCHNRMLKPHRFSMLCMLKKYGLLDETDWSLLKGHQIKNVIDSEGNIPYYIVGNVLYDEEIQNLKEEIQYFANIDVKKSKYEQDYDVDNGEWGFDWNKTFEMNHHSNSYINIVGESQFNFKDVVHITEKSIIPFHYSQFPIIVATKDHMKYMRQNFGFDYFDDLINYDFDSEPDDKKRFQMVFEEIKRLHSIKDEVISYYKTCRNKFRRNKELVLDMTKDKTDQIFFKGLINKRF